MSSHWSAFPVRTRECISVPFGQIFLVNIKTISFIFVLHFLFFLSLLISNSIPSKLRKITTAVISLVGTKDCISRIIVCYSYAISTWTNCKQKQQNKLYIQSLNDTLCKKVSVFGVIPVRVQFECRKVRTRITPNTDTLYAMTKSNLKRKQVK